MGGEWGEGQKGVRKAEGERGVDWTFEVGKGKRNDNLFINLFINLLACFSLNNYPSFSITLNLASLKRFMSHMMILLWRA